MSHWNVFFLQMKNVSQISFKMGALNFAFQKNYYLFIYFPYSFFVLITNIRVRLLVSEIKSNINWLICYKLVMFIKCINLTYWFYSLTPNDKSFDKQISENIDFNGFFDSFDELVTVNGSFSISSLVLYGFFFFYFF